MKKTFFISLDLLEMEVQLSLDCSEYIHKKDADSHLAVNTISLVKETGQRHATRNTLWIEKPHLELKVENGIFFTFVTSLRI